MKQGKLIAFEGIDGAGKSTQIQRLSSWLNEHNMKNICTAEPTRGVFGRQIRAARTERFDAAVERRLFVQDRMEHVHELIMPSLNAGIHVLTDRYYYSSIAYQGSRDRELGVDKMRLMQEIRAENEAIAPMSDVLVYCDLPPELAMARMKAGRAELDPFETLDNLRAVYEAYQWVVSFHPSVITLDATLPPDVLFEYMMEKLMPMLKE